jgi:hypothetical protein
MENSLENTNNLENIIEEREREAKNFLSIIGIDIQLGEIPFTEDQIRSIVERGGSLEWIPGGLKLRGEIEKLGSIFSQWWKSDPNFIDEPTREGWVLWIPEILKGSLNKSRRDQLYLCQVLSRDLSLDVSFGRASELAYLIFLFHFRRRVVLQNFWVRTETPYGEENNISITNFGGVDILRVSYRNRETTHFTLGISPIYRPLIKTGGKHV